MSGVNGEIRGKKPNQCAIYSVSTILVYWAPAVVKSIQNRKEKKNPNKWEKYMNYCSVKDNIGGPYENSLLFFISVANMHN